MTSPAAPARRLVLVPAAAPRRSATADPRLRRYQLARVAPEGRGSRSERFAHLQRMHD